ncbi:gametocyte-specific factor 1 homolog [Drosophila obscura]|uniref:gametocyte-specific factor 1 homolog n=1 Tax=Drosophila obscura TaxID=7282 RepID=UPI001BB13B8A|nr:gametocyte-specific factor 1 homolog [Drosophila obscura]
MSEKNDLIFCPFDKSHIILRSRMAVHLIRCARNNTDSKKVSCPFNGTHLIDANEIKNHVENCPNRSTFENFLKMDKKPDVASNHGCGKIRCPFNAMHKYTTHEMKTHVKECPNRSPYIPHAAIDQAFKYKSKSSENWDDEPPVGTYDPKASWAEKFVIGNPQGKTPSEKRAFRELERKRFEENGKF